jgi:hypothetical protein
VVSPSMTRRYSLHSWQLEKLLLEEGDAINLFEFIVNPDPEQGFAQTVENLFYLSFLIRDGKCALDVAEDTAVPKICTCAYLDHRCRAHRTGRRLV